jgi:hypothetical protein
MLRLLRRHRWTPAVDDQVKSGGGEPQVRAFALAGRSAIEAAIGALVQLVRGGDGVDGREKIEDRPLQRYTVGSARRPTAGPPREVADPGRFRGAPDPAAPRCPRRSGADDRADLAPLAGRVRDVFGEHGDQCRAVPASHGYDAGRRSPVLGSAEAWSPSVHRATRSAPCRHSGLGCGLLHDATDTRSPRDMIRASPSTSANDGCR